MDKAVVSRRRICKAWRPEGAGGGRRGAGRSLDAVSVIRKAVAAQILKSFARP